MQNGDEALPSIIFAGRGLLVKMLIILELHHTVWSKYAYLYVLKKKLAGKMTKKSKILRKNVRLALNNCALGFWITRMHLRQLGNQVLYTILEQFTSCAREIKIARPWHHILINLRSPRGGARYSQLIKIWAVTCDFQQCGILTSFDSDEPV